MWRRWWARKRPPATSPPPPPDPSDEEVLEATARAVVGRGLAAPAIFFLESSKPLSFVASQGLVFLGPFVHAVLDAPRYDAFCRLMEDRANVEKLLQRIEELEDERLTRAPGEKDDPGRRGEE